MGSVAWSESAWSETALYRPPVSAAPNPRWVTASGVVTAGRKSVGSCGMDGLPSGLRRIIVSSMAADVQRQPVQTEFPEE